MSPTKQREAAVERVAKPRLRPFALILGMLVLGVALVLVPMRTTLAQTTKGEGGESGEVHKQASAGAHKSSKSAAKGANKSETTAKDEAATAEENKPAQNQPADGDKPAEDLQSIPIGRGLPVQVNVGVFFVDVISFDDTNGNFEATTDIRLQWTDPRLRSESKSARGFKEYRGKEAEELLAKMWTPTVHVRNRIEDSLHEYVARRLRIYPSGEVETLARETASYKGHFDPESFPFDRQLLKLELVVRDDTTDEVAMRFDKDDVDFSRARRKAHLDGWNIGLVELRSSTVAGWNGDRYGITTAALAIDRIWETSLAPIFIPLLASLLIPLLAIWMNKMDEDGFVVDSFELANIGIGGLFSVIALSFAIYSSYGVIANSDNTVTRLFALNYAMLASTLFIVVVCFRFNLLARWFGKYVQQETFHFLLWAMPLLSMAVSLAFLLVAAA